MGSRFEFTEARTCSAGILINDEDPKNDLADDLGDDIGLELGDRGATALVITGSRTELLALLDEMRSLVEALPDYWPAFRDAFIASYIETALWADTLRDTTTNGEPDSEQVTDASPDDLTDDARADLRRSALAFLNDVEVLRNLRAAIDGYRGYTAEQAGHDFWLSRNGHGAGFWDRGLGEFGDRLHEIAKPYSSAHIWQDEDGSLHYEEG